MVKVWVSNGIGGVSNGKWEWRSLRVQIRKKKFEGENENEEGNL